MDKKNLSLHAGEKMVHMGTKPNFKILFCMLLFIHALILDFSLLISGIIKKE